LEQLKRFVALSGWLRARGLRWRLPLKQWAASGDCPPVIRNFLRQAQAFDLGSELYISPFKPLEIEGHRDELNVAVDYERGGKADAFPLPIDRGREGGNPRKCTVLYPLGMETLMEGNAHAICRTLVERYFPQPVADRFRYKTRMFTSEDEKGQSDQRAAQTQTPYMVGDLLITRFLASHGITRFPRDLVLGVIDKTLSHMPIDFRESMAGVTEAHIDRVGARLVKTLESEDPQALADRGPSDDAETDRRYKALLVEMEKVGDWQSVEDDRTPAASLAIWEKYMAQTFIVPLLRKRLASGHRPFRTYEGFLAMLPRIGLPPARVANGELMLGRMPARVQQAWWHQLMLGEIARQLVRGEAHVFCPRAWSAIPGIATMNLALEGDCQRHIRLGCGTFRLGQPGLTPKCAFEGALRICALERMPAS
jgi:hypothetical protein